MEHRANTSTRLCSFSCRLPFLLGRLNMMDGHLMDFGPIMMTRQGPNVYKCMASIAKRIGVSTTRTLKRTK
jgi:hypothetical protein